MDINFLSLCMELKNYKFMNNDIVWVRKDNSEKLFINFKKTEPFKEFGDLLNNCECCCFITPTPFKNEKCGLSIYTLQNPNFLSVSGKYELYNYWASKNGITTKLSSDIFNYICNHVWMHCSKLNTLKINLDKILNAVYNNIFAFNDWCNNQNTIDDFNNYKVMYDKMNDIDQQIKKLMHSKRNIMDALTQKQRKEALDLKRKRQMMKDFV